MNAKAKRAANATRFNVNIILFFNFGFSSQEER